MEKHIKFDKPIPEAINKALKEKRKWREKVQSGEIELNPSQKVS
jgi:hypothetical protein